LKKNSQTIKYFPLIMGVFFTFQGGFGINMKNKHMTRLGLKLILIVISLLSIFGPSSMAFAKTIIKLKTFSVAPAQVALFEVKSDRLYGKAIMTSVIEDLLDQAYFQLLDENGAEIFSETTTWDSVKFKKGNQVIIPFDFDWTENPLVGKFTLKFELRNKNQDPVGRGETHVVIEGSKASVSDRSEIRNLQVEIGSEALLSFDFVPSFSGEFQPVVEFFERFTTRLPLDTYKQELVSVKSGEVHKFVLAVPSPVAAESYVLRVQVSSEERGIVTGNLQHRFLVSGDFGEIKGFVVEPSRYLEADEEVGFSLFGSVQRPKESVELQLKINQKKGGKVVQVWEERQSLKPSDWGDFETEFLLKLVTSATSFDLEATLVREGKVIEEKTLQTKSFSPPVKEEILKPQSSIEIVEDLIPEEMKTFEIPSAKGIMLPILTVLIAALGWWLFQMKQKTFKILIFMPFLWGMTAEAYDQVNCVIEWLHPGNNWSYNPSPSAEFPDFHRMGFQGHFYNPTTGLGCFIGDPNAVDVVFTQGATVVTAANVAGITIDLQTTYEFEVDITSLGLLDGEWEVEVQFEDPNNLGTWFATSWSDPPAAGVNGRIKVDTTAPTLSFAYTPDQSGGMVYTNQPVDIAVSCVDATAGCQPGGLSALDIKGNFCSNGVECDTLGTRNFEVCDLAGNCSNYLVNQAAIDFYDPVGPEFSLFEVWNTSDNTYKLDGIGPAAKNSFAAASNFTLELTAPDATDSGAVSIDSSACGSQTVPSPSFYEKLGNRCAEQILPCRLTPTQAGTFDQSVGETAANCVSSCGVGAVWNPITGLCDDLCSHDQFPICFDLDLSP
jgi:hypothetical protein